MPDYLAQSLRQPPITALNRQIKCQLSLANTSCHIERREYADHFHHDGEKPSPTSKFYHRQPASLTGSNMQSSTSTQEIRGFSASLKVGSMLMLRNSIDRKFESLSGKN